MDGEQLFGTTQQIRDYVRKYNIQPGGNTYFITQTLKPKFYKYSTETQRNLTYHQFGAMLKEFTDDFICCCEITEQANIHYHGIVVFKNEINKLKMINKCKSKQSIGFMKITPKAIVDEIPSMMRAKEYIIKDVDKTSKFVKTPLILQIYSDYIFN